MNFDRSIVYCVWSGATQNAAHCDFDRHRMSIAANKEYTYGIYIIYRYRV